MPTYQITSPDGRQFRITGPDQAGAVAALKKHLGQPSQPEPQPVAPQQERRPNILPLRRDAESGNIELAVPRIADPIISAVTLPGDVASGRTPVRGPDGQIAPEVIERSIDFAGVATPGTAVGRAVTPKPAGTPVRVTERVQTPLQAAAQRQGVDLPVAAASDSRVVQGTGERLSNVPIVGQPLKSASERAISQLDDRARRVQDDLGTGEVPLAGDAARRDIETFITEDIGRRVSSAFDRVDGLVDNSVSRPLTDTAKKVAEIRSRRRSAALGEESQAVRIVDEALQRPEGLTYTGVKDLRTAVRELLDNPSALPARNISQSELKQLHTALTNDLRATVRAAGGEPAVKAWEAANRFTRVVSRERESLNTILRTQSDEGVFERIIAMAGSTSRADIKRLAQARRAVSDDTWNQIGSAVIARLGRDAEGNFTPTRFLTAWGKLSNQGKRQLFGDETVRQSLDDLATISSRFKELQKFANPSGTAPNLLNFAAGAGVVVAPVALLKIAIPGYALARALAKPSTSKQVVRWARAYEVAVRNPTRASLQTLRNRAQPLAVTFADETGLPTAQLLSGLESVQGTQADQESGQRPNPQEVPQRPYDPRFDT